METEVFFLNLISEAEINRDKRLDTKKMTNEKMNINWRKILKLA